MALFKITDIIDGNTIQVEGWKWGDFRGKRVRIQGYNITGQDKQSFAKMKLETLLNGEQIELKNVVTADKGESGDDLLYCSVFLNDIDISQYFPELTA